MQHPIPSPFIFWLLLNSTRKLSPFAARRPRHEGARHRPCPPGCIAQGRPVILGMSITTFTLLHTVLSLVGIVAGLVVAGGLATGKRLDRWAAVFLVTTVLANASGFGFPFVKFLPSHAVGGISLVDLAIWPPPRGRSEEHTSELQSL